MFAGPGVLPSRSVSGVSDYTPMAYTPNISDVASAATLIAVIVQRISVVARNLS